ncbi:MAG TPA: iron ABC transporter [Flavobacteriales bacterium]|nr:iron ABC transporter [Crocinitomicaceae bacterium]HCL47227.1 iron ABC transporter [Flavobacteriales bacterium]|tara:strand:- start:871 stop:1845 length:975 start_codon:yes stop_codon:yes gene_type:complete
MKTRLVFLLMLLALVSHVALGEVEIVWGELLGALLTGGEVNELHATIVKEVRWPRALTAMTSGTLLGWLGLLMQTWFRNPLAGPGVLGITSGGSLGVALAVLLGLALPAWMAAAMGCFAVLLLIGVGARRFVSPVTTLVFGLMISYAVSAVVTVLQSSATAEALQTYVFWGMGTFGKASFLQATSCVALQLLLGMWMIRRAKWLDMWTLGEDLAQTMGVPKARLHLEILLLTGLILGVVTSVCGPLAFLGLATPHVYRFFHPKRGHMDAIQGIGAWGALLALLADGVVRWTDSLAMHWPLNAVLAILGAPVVLAVLWKRTHDWS